MLAGRGGYQVVMTDEEHLENTVPEPGGEELLEGLSGTLGPVDQGGVDVVRDVSDLHVRHACTLHA